MKNIYTDSCKDAEGWGEIDLWRESHRLNCDCARAIEKAIKQNFDGLRLAPDTAKPVVEEYGFPRVKWVLANTLKENAADGRFSTRHRQWLASEHIPQYEGNWLFSVTSHPAVLDGFIGEVKKQWDALGMYNKSHCIPEDGERLHYEGRVLIFDAERMKHEHLHPEEQLFLAETGFGCMPNARGTKIFGQFLWDNERCHITRQSVIGAIREDCLPDWAKAKLEQMKITVPEGHGGMIL